MKSSFVMVGAAALGLAVVAAFAAKPTGPIAAVINFYGAPLSPSAPFPGIHADQAVTPGTVDPTVDYTDGTQNVAAFFFSGTNNAGIDTTSDEAQPTFRRLSADLSSPISVVVPGTPPFVGGATSHTINAHMSQNMIDPDRNGNLVCCSGNGLMTVTYGQLRYGQVTISWDDTGGRPLQWVLLWTAQGSGNGLGSCLQTSANITGPVWTVNTVGYAGAAAFPSLAPNCASDPANYDVARLSFAPTNLKKGQTPTWTVQGYYHVPFLFTIRRK